MSRIRASTIYKSVVRRMVHPVHLFHAIKLQTRRRWEEQARDDPQLKLFSRLLPGDFLHYGYFDEPGVPPEELSLNDIARAQLRYAHLLTDRVVDRESPVLDVGCGMGGLIRTLRERRFSPVGLTPDRRQLDHIRDTYQDVPVIAGKFEEIPLEGNAGRYGTAITAESLQYLELDRALPLLDAILKPGGRWVACDYFRKSTALDTSGHEWAEFVTRLTRGGWQIIYEQDITRNVLPTLRYVHMWAGRLGVPLIDYGVGELRRRAPGLHYVLEEGVATLQDVVAGNLRVVDPAYFASHKVYMLLVIQRAGESGEHGEAEQLPEAGRDG